MTVNVLTIQRLSAADRARIEAVDLAVRLTDAGDQPRAHFRLDPCVRARTKIPQWKTQRGRYAVR